MILLVQQLKRLEATCEPITKPLDPGEQNAGLLFNGIALILTTMSTQHCHGDVTFVALHAKHCQRANVRRLRSDRNQSCAWLFSLPRFESCSCKNDVAKCMTFAAWSRDLTAVR